MIEKNLEELKMGKMSSPKFKDRLLRLLWVQDIFTKPNENYYKVLFQDIESRMYLRESIFPEYLSYYTLGSCYRDGVLFENVPPLGETFSVTIESTGDNRFKRISEVIKDKEYNLTHSFINSEGNLIDFTEENKRQYCIVFQSGRQTIIFPCSVIGACYFTSTSMREQIFAQNLKGLYESGELDRKTKTARIIMKPGSANSDTMRIIRFATNKFAKNRWNAIKNNLLQEKKRLKRQGKDGSFVPLKIDFPIEEAFQLDVRAVKLPGEDVGKEKILVLEILKEYSRFEFERVIRIRKEHKTELAEGKSVIHTKAHKTTDEVTQKTPSSELTTAIINNPVEDKSAAADDIEIIDEYITAEGPKVHNVYERSEQKADTSNAQPRWNGDKLTRRGVVEQNPEENKEAKNKDAFTLDDFIQMAKKLPETEGVTLFEMHKRGYVPFRYESPKECSLKESYDKTPNNRRQFIYVTLKYKGKNICLVEIDQNNLTNGSSTYVLVSANGYGFTSTDAEVLLKLYVVNSKMDEFEKEFAAKEVNFLRKNHPAEKGEKYYRRWCEELLRKVRRV